MQMIKQNIKQLVRAIDSNINNFNKNFDSLAIIYRYEDYKSESSQEQISYIEDYLLDISKSIYFSFITLFDTTRTYNSLRHFKEIIKDRYKDRKEISEGEYIDIADEFYSIISSDFYMFLKPFIELYLTNETPKSVIDKSYIISLESLLAETNMLCKLSKTTPKKEPDVYNTVKQYIFILFPKSMHVTGQNFPTVAKVYKPDIIIPECNAVVEYKYIDKLDKVTSTIAGISDDVKGYINNSMFSRFYAVFYMKKQYLPRKKLEKIWEEKRFPKNWKCFFVVESNE